MPKQVKQVKQAKEAVPTLSPEREKTPRSDIESEVQAQMPPSKVCKVTLSKVDTDLAFASQEAENKANPEKSGENSAESFFETVGKLIEARDVEGLKKYRKEQRAKLAKVGLPVEKCYPEEKAGSDEPPAEVGVEASNAADSPPLMTAAELLSGEECETILEVAPAEAEDVAGDPEDGDSQSGTSWTSDGLPGRLAELFARRDGGAEERAEDPSPSPTLAPLGPVVGGPGVHRHSAMRGRARAPPTSLFRRMKATRRRAEQNQENRCGYCRPCPPCPPCYLIKPSDKVPEDLAIPLNTAPPVAPLMGRTRQALRCLFTDTARDAWSEEAFSNGVDLDRSIAAYLNTLVDAMERDAAEEEKYLQDKDTSAQSLVDYGSSDDEGHVEGGLSDVTLDVPLDEPQEEALEDAMRSMDGILVAEDPVALFNGTTKILEDCIASANYVNLPRETLLACHLRLKSHYLEYLKKVASSHANELLELKRVHKKEREEDKKKMRNTTKNLTSSRNVRRLLNEKATELQREVELLKKRVVLNEDEVVNCQKIIRQREEQLHAGAAQRARDLAALANKEKVLKEAQLSYCEMVERVQTQGDELSNKRKEMHQLALRVKTMERNHQANIQDAQNQILSMHSSRCKEFEKGRKDLMKKLNESEKKAKVAQESCDRLTATQRDSLQQREHLIRERDALRARLRGEEALRNRAMLAGGVQPGTSQFYSEYARDIRRNLAEFRIIIDGSQDGQMVNLPALYSEFSQFWANKASRMNMSVQPARGLDRPSPPASGEVRNIAGLLPLSHISMPPRPVSLPTCPLPRDQCVPTVMPHPRMPTAPFPWMNIPVTQPLPGVPVIHIPETVELDDIEVVAGPEIVGHIQVTDAITPKKEDMKMEEEVEYVEDQPLRMEDSPAMVVEEQIDVESFKIEDMEHVEAGATSSTQSETSPFQGGAGQTPAAPTRP